MDPVLVRWLIFAGAAVPYVVEIVAQVPLLTRLMRALPEEVRRRLPRHPRRAGLALFGSTRFFLALFRYAFRDEAGEGAELRALKRAVRRSAVREGVFGVLFATTIALLWRHGWRPWF
ncbi:MAG TPA: hypothetical protein VHO67_14115 [Polyangia bacterium]|nr:hypothetical protein [Polyangia bacterium]